MTNFIFFVVFHYVNHVDILVNSSGYSRLTSDIYPSKLFFLIEFTRNLSIYF